MKTRHDPSTKPYFRCLNCPRFRRLCGGRPTRDMDLDEWCEYMRDVKDTFHLTNAYIAKESEVSLTTIENIMALNRTQDIMRATARRLNLSLSAQCEITSVISITTKTPYRRQSASSRQK